MGTLIALERVAALRRRWMFAAPLLSGIGWILGLALPGSWIGPLIITLGSLFTVGILIEIVRREPRIYTAVMAVGSGCWLIGNLFWISGAGIFKIVWLWAAFLVLTIVGERVELSRIQRFKLWHLWVFALSCSVLLVGALVDPQSPQIGTRLAGVGLLALAVWLLRMDIARRNLRHPSALPRFIATCLYSGFIWLGVSGVLDLVYGPQFAGLRYDASIHTVFVGFVFSMIFGHALIILPALTQINVPFRQRFYLPLIFLHGSLLLRISGDLAGWQSGRMWGGLLNEVSILGFIGLFVFAIVKQAKQPNDLVKPFVSINHLRKD